MDDYTGVCETDPAPDLPRSSPRPPPPPLPPPLPSGPTPSRSSAGSSRQASLWRAPGSPNGTVTSATYSWTRDGVRRSPAAATSSQHFLQFADEGHELRCRLTVETADGRLSGESAPLVAPVIDDGPPRVLHGAPLLMPGRGMMMGQWTSVPAAMRDWYALGRARGDARPRRTPRAGVMGPTGAHWKFELLREGAVVETMERDGDPMWQGSPAGWDRRQPAVARARPVRRLARAGPGRSRQALRMPADREQMAPARRPSRRRR